MTTVSKQLREAIAAYTSRIEPQHRLALNCDMTPSTLSRFVAGKGGISLEAADRLAVYLGLVLVQREDQ